MKKHLAIVTAFYEECSVEVRGHAAEPPDAEVRARLRAFLRGELSEQERQPLMDLLSEQPEWVDWLAEEVKKNRKGKTNEPSSE